VSVPAINLTTPAEYLAAERKAEFRHELVNGEVYAMSGVSRVHSKLATNSIVAIDRRIRQHGCSTSGSDLRVRIPATEAYVYPDVVVYCGDGKWLDKAFDTLENPIVVIEILSPSAENYDRGAKFGHYRHIDSLKTYVLVSQEFVLVEVYTRQTDGTWLFTAMDEPEQELSLPIHDVTIPISEIYDRVPVPSGPQDLPAEVVRAIFEKDKSLTVPSDDHRLTASL